jgi:hypothetical protein
MLETKSYYAWKTTSCGSQPSGIARAQRHARKYIKPGASISIVDEFLAERREEAKRE